MTPRYPPTELRKELRAALSLLPGPLPTLPQVGVYGSGAISILDVDSSKSLLQSWGDIVAADSIPVATTGFGDVFLWDPTQGICFLEVQRAEVSPIGRDLQRFLTDFLGNPKLGEAVLRDSKLQQLVAAKGPLKYGETFILEPWQMLGGTDRIENYAIGKTAVFVDLVGQTHLQH